MAVGIVISLVMAGVPGCGVKKGNMSPKGRTDHTAVSHETEEANKEGENITSEEALQPKALTADFGEEFQSIHGCAVIFDPSKNTYTFYNKEECETRVSPYSTFKVISVLMGLHNQIITSEESKMGYNGKEYPVASWNANLSLKDAFGNSCIWYFRKVIDEVGQETVQKELTDLNYGNCDISDWSGNNTDSFPECNGFWLDSSLKISPVEQIDILRDIMDGNTLYTESEVNILKSLMLIDTNSSEKIYGKTGSGTDGKAWFIGFVEKKETYVYFAIQLNDSTSDAVNGSKAKEIALYIINTSIIPACP